MTISVRVVNCANWDEDVLIEREGYGVHGIQTLKHGEVSEAITVEHNKPPTVLHIKAGSIHKQGYLGEVDVTTHSREP